jgi:PhnB protein
MTTTFKPHSYSTVSPYLVAKDAAATIEFLKSVFQAEELRRFPNPDGRIMPPKFESMTR